ncbi:uncharacterized protein F5147DRAFT_655199 [Suillus discolor]|uniref:DUF6533 domain-containing protein n=1 Tax=Suillus discolor TaxID=1912936 RepID=A0A9P7F225_9AGAM|nr:uncharacterized protein F5147DRAFT_655199 [Suillus discolor]KAG2101548.1 hypothetical protein F5147DRAFT_655199 [Suillus discolor]
MTVVSNDPNWWPTINSTIFYSYWIVAAGVVVVYDWALTLGQEIELIWIRYIGIPYSVSSLTISNNVLGSIPFVSLTDAGCNILGHTGNGTNVVVAAMLGVIMIARLHAMYQGSKMMLIFLVIIFLSVNIVCGTIAAIQLKDLVLAHWVNTRGVDTLWIVHRGLFQSADTISRTLFCKLVIISPEVQNSNAIAVQILDGALQILLVVQLFLLGPRLILSVREYNAKLVADSDAETSMNSIVFQEHLKGLGKNIYCCVTTGTKSLLTYACTNCASAKTAEALISQMHLHPSGPWRS